MWARSLAALLLGCPLAVALVGLAAVLSGNQAVTTLPMLLLFFPVWVGAMSCAFAFKNGLRAWLWMGGATLAGFGLLHLLKATGLVRIMA